MCDILVLPEAAELVVGYATMQKETAAQQADESRLAKAEAHAEAQHKRRHSTSGGTAQAEAQHKRRQNPDHPIRTFKI